MSGVPKTPIFSGAGKCRDSPKPRDDLAGPATPSLEARTGPVRSRRPIFHDLFAPCNQACPAGEDVQAWLALAEASRFREAWEVILRDNPLPAIHGRVCYHPCESACNREPLDGAVSIHAVERFLGDRALAEGWTLRPEAPPSGKRVLVVGAVPAGLSAAWHLALRGHQVEIRDAGPVAGGMMRFAIPAYRRPRNVLREEVGRIRKLGVRITLNHRVENLLAEKEEGGFDAAFVAVGAHLSRRVEIPAMDAGTVLEALSFLRDVEGTAPPRLGRRVAVYGGGNTALDAARAAMRLGHEPIVIYRRDREHAPAHDEELDEALTEGVRIHWLRTIKSIEGRRFTVERMELDEEGRHPRLPFRHRSRGRGPVRGDRASGRAAVAIPVAVKLGPYFSSMGEMAGRLVRAGRAAPGRWSHSPQPQSVIAFTVQEAPPQAWRRAVDTSLESPEDIREPGDEAPSRPPATPSRVEAWWCCAAASSPARRDLVHARASLVPPQVTSGR